MGERKGVGGVRWEREWGGRDEVGERMGVGGVRGSEWIVRKMALK